jgi:hypothetical protein
VGEGVSYYAQQPTDLSLLCAAILGPLTVIPIILILAIEDQGISSFALDPRYTFGYYIGETLNLGLALISYCLLTGIFCLFGLALFGMPLARLLGARIIAWPWALFAIASGALAGSVFAVVLFRMGGFDRGTFIFGALIFGALFGTPTGFWFWFFHRRVLLARAALEAQS